MIDTLEKEWKQSQPQLTLSQWIDVFPEAKPYLKSKMEKLRLLKENLQQVITEKRLKIENLNTDYFSKWFYLQELFVWWVEDLKKVKKEIKKISWAVSPRLKSKNAIGEYEIAKARAYPIKELLENYGYKVKNNFIEQKKLYMPVPVKAAYPKYNFFKKQILTNLLGIYQYSTQSWMWIGNFYVAALVKSGRIKDSEGLYT
jgi:hypothetical protein